MRERKGEVISLGREGASGCSFLLEEPGERGQSMGEGKAREAGAGKGRPRERGGRLWRREGGGGGRHWDVSAAIRHRKEVLDRDAPLRRSMAAESLAAKRDGSEGPSWQSMRGEQDRQEGPGRGHQGQQGTPQPQVAAKVSLLPSRGLLSPPRSGLPVAQ